MTLTTDKNGTKLTVHLSGELNTMTAPNLTALLDKELGGVKELTLDFAECDYVSSAGLRVLLATFKQMKAAKGTMALANVGENFQDVLNDESIDTVVEAMGGLHPAYEFVRAALEAGKKVRSQSPHSIRRVPECFSSQDTQYIRRKTNSLRCKAACFSA